MAKQAQIHLNEVPNGWSEEAVDFFNKVNYFFYLVYNSYYKESQNYV